MRLSPPSTAATANANPMLATQLYTVVGNDIRATGGCCYAISNDLQNIMVILLYLETMLSH